MKIKQICFLFSLDKMEILIPTVPSTNQIQDHTQTVRGRQMGLADTGNIHVMLLTFMHHVYTHMSKGSKDKS